MRYLIALLVASSLLAACTFESVPPDLGRVDIASDLGRPASEPPATPSAEQAEKQRLHELRVACLNGGREWDASTGTCVTPPTPTPERTPTPPAIPVPTATATAADVRPTPTSVQSEAGVFWNSPFHLPFGASPTPACEEEFRFTDRLVDLDAEISLFFGPGWHIAPHDHMVYWLTGRIEDNDEPPKPGSQFSRRVDIFAPTDIYAFTVTRWENPAETGGFYNDWTAYLTTCNQHQLVFHHVEPTEELLDRLHSVSPSCASSTTDALASGNTVECRWRGATTVSAGTAILRSSGYSSGFDFGLTLYGLTAEELQVEPGYGHSINPWLWSAGNAVCPLEYFPEPHRSDYLALLGMGCGPFNQDAPGTAMGFWVPSPTREWSPDYQKFSLNEEETMWLFATSNTPSVHRLTVGTTVRDIDRGQYRFTYESDGLINRRWDQMVSGHIYCVVLQRQTSFYTFDETPRTALLLQISADGAVLTVEANPSRTCDQETFVFSGTEQRFYR